MIITTKIKNDENDGTDNNLENYDEGDMFMTTIWTIMKMRIVMV